MSSPPPPDATVPAPAPGVSGDGDAARDAPGRDPWVIGGFALLALLTAAVLLIYRSAPQSAAEVGSSAWVTVAPDAFTPHVARARERLSAALRARAAGDTAAALARYAEAEEEASAARSLASADTARARTATELWAGAVLDRAELTLAAGARPWYRGDNVQLLREAQASVQRVRAVPVAAPTRARADALAADVERKLKPGPLEWLPR